MSRTYKRRLLRSDVRTRLNRRMSAFWGKADIAGVVQFGDSKQ